VYSRPADLDRSFRDPGDAVRRRFRGPVRRPGQAGWGSQSEGGARLNDALDAAFDGFTLLTAVHDLAGPIVDFAREYVNQIGAKLAGSTVEGVAPLTLGFAADRGGIRQCVTPHHRCGKPVAGVRALRPQQAEVAGPCDGFGAGGALELPVDRGDVGFHGVTGDVQLLADLTEGEVGEQ
jgi:hypothetical protein